MKIAIQVLVTMLLPLAATPAAITGQWDFSSGDFTATIGQNMGFLDEETEAGTEFGTTTAFGLPGLPGGGGGSGNGFVITAIIPDGSYSNYTITWAGAAPPYTLQRKSDLAAPAWTDVVTTADLTATVAAGGDAAYYRVISTGTVGGETPGNVMKFPMISEDNPFGGYRIPSGAAANGGDNAFFINKYTIIMDVLYPEGSTGMARALFDSDLNGNAEFFVGSNNGIGAASFLGEIKPNTWHRIAIAVDQSLNLISKYIDGVKVGDEVIGGSLDGVWAIDTSEFGMFGDDTGDTATGYLSSLQFRDEVVPEGLIAALGGPTANGILVGDPPNPYIVETSPDPATARFPARSTVGSLPEVRIVLQDGVSKVVPGSIALSFGPVDENGDATLAPVTPTISQADGTTTISYTPETPLLPLSVHQVGLVYTDDATPPRNLGTTYRFAIGPFLDLPSDIAGSVGDAGDRGFIVRSVQGPEETVLPQQISRAVQQLNGTLEDPSNPGTLLPDEAASGPNEDGSYDVDTINFEREGFEIGNFFEDGLFPGIPGTEGHTNQFATEVITYLELEAGFYQFGTQVWIERTDIGGGGDDDGFTLYAGANPKDIFSTVVHSFERTAEADPFTATTDDNQFNVVAPVDGLYPFRLVYFQKSGGASLEWYSIDPETDEKILINDGSDPRAIKAYQSSASPVHDGAYVAELSPNPGAQGVLATVPVEILLIDDATQVNQASVRLFLNDLDVTAQSSIEKSGERTTVIYQPNPGRAEETNAMRLVFTDNLGTESTRTWTFTSQLGTNTGTTVTGLWNFETGLEADVGQALEFFGGPGGLSETNTLFANTDDLPIDGINGESANVMVVPYIRSNELGYVMRHGISPNGGGTRVNQYTLIYDVWIDTGGDGAAGMIQIDSLTNTNDGDYFWQGNNFGQGAGGYEGLGTFTAGAWHRIAFAVDLAATPPVVTKFADGIKQDDWEQPSLDFERRALRESAILFADGDEHRMWYVNSIQIREGKLSDAELESLGGPEAQGIPIEIDTDAGPAVTGLWNFETGLEADVGQPLEFFGGAGSLTETNTVFENTDNLPIDGIGGQPVNVMVVPYIRSNELGYIMRHGIAPNGGGTKVNQYTLIYDVWIDTAGDGAAGMIQIDSLTNTNDGDYFWQGNNFGQGAGGYEGLGTFTAGAWHRISFAVDLAATPPVVTKFADGIKQDDWEQPSLDFDRRALKEFAILFGDGDEHRMWYVNSIQIRDGKLSDAALEALGGPDPDGIPVD